MVKLSKHCLIFGTGIVFGTQKIFDFGNDLVHYPSIICTLNHILQKKWFFLHLLRERKFVHLVHFYILHTCVQKSVSFTLQIQIYTQLPMKLQFANLAHMATFAQILGRMKKVATILL